MPTHLKIIVREADGTETEYVSAAEAAAALDITYATVMKRAKDGTYDVRGRRVFVVRPERGPRRVFSTKLDDETADRFTAYLKRKALLSTAALRDLIVAELNRDEAGE